MINANFHKVAAVTLASIVAISTSVFSGAADAGAKPKPTPTPTSTATPKPPTPTPTVKPTPTPTPKPDKIALVKAIAAAYTQVGNALAVANASALSPQNKVAVVQRIAKCPSIGDATSFANSSASGREKTIAQSLAELKICLGDATAVANSDAKGDKALATALAKATTTVDNAIAIVNATVKP